MRYIKNNRIFIDTNILIYAYSHTEIEKKERITLLLKRESLFMSTQVVNEFVWIMSRKFNVDMGYLKTISNNLFDIYEVSLITKSTIDKAIDISLKLKFSHWDSLIVASAIESNCDLLYTEDLQHGQVIEDRLTALNPFR